MDWVSKDASRAKYGEALNNLKNAYSNYTKTAEQDLVLRGMTQISQVQFLNALIGGTVPKPRLKAFIPQVVGGEPIANREFIKFMLRKAADLPDGQKIEAIEKRFGNLKADARLKAEDEFAQKAVENKNLTTDAGLNSLLEMSADDLKKSKDEFVSLVAEMAPSIAGAFQRQQQLGTIIAPNRLTFMQGMAMFKAVTPYPDANFTQRFTYGYVKGYRSREAEFRYPFTTLDGVFEKETGRDPFKNPEKLRSLWESKDYGMYGVNGTMPVNFLSTNDIIGGNSGSPVLNAKGEQVGIAFDGNYEGLGNDFFYNEEKGRTISVDIRYVMFITDKFGGAGWILKELNVKKSKGK
jgi:hypothetical protein